LQAWFINEMDSAMHAAYGERKHSLFAQLPRELVEIGPGAGANFRYYPRGTRIVAIEPNSQLHARLRQRALKYGHELELLDASAEKIPLGDESATLVVGTLVLCSVQSPSQVLHEVLRILKPGGQYLFIEHVAAAKRSIVAAEQWALRRVWPLLFAGCRVDQDALHLIEDVGFESVAYCEFPIGWNVLPFSPHIVGTAIK
jgi:ubiquinone/menaquinone biosynthesis C-methylase UbiE